MLNSIYKAASNIKDQVNTQVQYRSILKESTSNEPWNVSNTKLQVLADTTYNWDDYQVVMKHLWSQLQCKPKEWRRIAKALHVMDYLVKNGAPRVIQDLKDDMYKFRSFQDFQYKEPNGVVQGAELRDKAKSLCDLLNDPSKIQYEREFAKQTREKFNGIASQNFENVPSSSGSQPAGPVSGKKFGGFGSEDIAKLGYGNQEQFGAGGPYDPYTKTLSTTTDPQHKKKEELKKKVQSDSDSSLDSNADSDDSDYKRKKEKKLKKEKAKQEASSQNQYSEQQVQNEQKFGQQSLGLSMAPKSTRQFVAPVSQNQQQNLIQQQSIQSQQSLQNVNNQQSLMDLLGGPSNTPIQSQQTGFPFINGQQQQQNQDLFGGMNINNQTNQTNQNSFGFMNNNNQFQNIQQTQFQAPQQQQNQFNLFNNMSLNNNQQSQQQPISGNLFDGLSQNNISNQPNVFTPSKKQTLWDDPNTSKLIDISGSNLLLGNQNKNQQQPEKPEPNLLFSQMSSFDTQSFQPSQPINNGFGGMQSSLQGSGFKPQIDPSLLMNQMSMQQQQQLQMQQIQMQQRMLLLQQQQQMSIMGQGMNQGQFGNMAYQTNPLAMNNPLAGINPQAQMMGINPQFQVNQNQQQFNQTNQQNPFGFMK